MELPQNSQFRFVRCECSFFSAANLLQIISPIALATAYFSMPQAVIPFKLNAKSFFIATLVIMAVVRLLFAVLGALLRQSWWWKKITTWVKTMQLDEMTRRLSTSHYGNRFALRGVRSYPDRATEGVEMDTFGV
jgi:hypothetical protein